jgi:DNA-directed RNA polymerase subunit RPC12/RpoP
MICIFCRSENVSNDNTIDAKNIVSCNNCNGKYLIKDKRKLIIKYPKYNINPIISIFLMLLILLIILINYLMETILKINNYNDTIYITLLIIIGNLVFITMIISSFQNIYNYFKYGFMIFQGGITTKEDFIFSKIFNISLNFIIGIIMLLTMLDMDIYIIKNMIK